MKRIVSFAITAVYMLMMLTLFTGAKTSQRAKLVAITFDDGPSQYTDELLDGLKARGAKATFFMVGTNIKYHKDTVVRMHEEGHQLATHTMDHANLPKLSADGIRQKVEGVNEILAEYVGEARYFLRPPYGAINDTVRSTVKAPLILWSVDTLDWKSRNADAVYQNIMRETTDGSIILLHDLYKTSVEAALRAITSLQAQGYTFVTVEQLMKRRGITPTDGKVYYSCYYEGIDLPLVSMPVIAQKRTILGTKVTIGKGEAKDIVYFTRNGDAVSQKSEKYDGGFYIDTQQSVQALSVNQEEISDISSETLSPTDAVDPVILDKFYQRYCVPLLRISHDFVIGMKV